MAVIEGMTITMGHTILAIPRVGGVCREDVHRVAPEDGAALFPHCVDPVVA